MSVKCQATTRGGKPCNVVASAGQWCAMHDPGRAEARRRNAAKGGRRAGRGRPSVSPEIEAINANLDDLYTGLLAGTYLPGTVAVGTQVQNAKLRAVEANRKLKETEELEGRIADLENAVAWNENAKTNARSRSNHR